MKKVLHIKLQAPNFENNGISNGFRANGFEVTEVNWQHYRLQHKTAGLRKHLIETASELKPDIIFMQLQREDVLDEVTCIELSKHGFVVNYTFDVREDISWYKKLAPHIGLTVFGDFDSLEQCEKEGINNVAYMQSSADFDFYKPVPATRDYGEIIFLGNNYENTQLDFPFAKERTELINFMQKEYGDRFVAYGRGYGESLNPEQEREAYSSCKIAITHNMFHKPGYCSDRGFRATACGAFVIHNYYAGFEDAFKEDGFAFWYKFEDIKTVIDAVEKTGVPHRSFYNQFFYKKHSYAERLKQLERIINKFKNNAQ